MSVNTKKYYFHSVIIVPFIDCFFSKEVTDVNTCSIYVEFIREGRTHFNDSTEVVSCYVLFLPKTLNANNKCLDNVLVFHMFVVGKL